MFTVDDNLHEGWNYFKWENSNDYPKYRFYRFYNQHRVGCLITEMKLTGVETVSNTDSTYTCPVAVEMNDTVISTLTNTVQYVGTLTPLLTSVEPRYGPVTGGTSVTFSGSQFSSDISKY